MPEEIQRDHLAEQPKKEDQIIEQLEQANAHLARQNSLRRIFLVGIIYGIGVFIGSAILATIALGTLGPFFKGITWIQQPYETGSKLTPR